MSLRPPPITILGCLEFGLKSLPFVAPYFIVSVALTFYNKWILNGGGDRELPFPLSITTVHLTFTFFIIWLVRRWSYPGCRDDKPVTLSWRDYLVRVLLPAVAGALDIGLSNWSLVYITISLYAMSKSTCIAFILFFSVLLRLEKPRISLFAVVMLISTGVFMFTYQEDTTFDREGFALVMIAAFLGGLRWSFSQVLIQNKESGLSNPVDIVFHLLPWMLVVLAPMALYVEGSHVGASMSLLSAKTLDTALVSVTYVMIGAVLACLLNVFEFVLLAHTSSLTLSIIGIVKEISVFPLAHHVNGDKFTAVNIVGILICLSGITLHVILKASRAEETSSSNGIRQAGTSGSASQQLTSYLKMSRRRNHGKEQDLAKLMGPGQGGSSDEDEVIFQTSNL